MRISDWSSDVCSSDLPRLKGIKIVDCDTHFTEPPDMFTALAPASMKHKVPVVKRVNGVDRWFIGDRDFGTLGGNVIRNDQNKLLGRLAFPTIDEGHACAHEVKPRSEEHTSELQSLMRISYAVF